jgi:hypothetical protein
MNWLLWLALLFFLLRAYPLCIFFLVLYVCFWLAQNIFTPKVREEADFLKPETSFKLGKIGFSISKLGDMLVLRREFERLRASGKIDRKTFSQWNREVDQFEERFLREHGAIPGNDLWRERRDAAWDILNAYADMPLGPAPWKEKPVEPVADLEPVKNEVTEPEPSAKLSEPLEVDPPVFQAKELAVQDEKPEDIPVPLPETKASQAAPLRHAEPVIELRQAVAEPALEKPEEKSAMSAKAAADPNRPPLRVGSFKLKRDFKRA